jgi:RNA polymerase sigma-70 factor (ECF subfamily)
VHPDRTGPDDSAERSALLQREKRAVEKAQAGDLAALEPILANHAEALFMGILGRVGDRAQAEDILKDTLVTALERISTYTFQQRSIYHWLRQIAWNKVIDFHRAQGRRKRLCQALRAELSDTEEATAPLLLSAAEERQLAQRRIESVLSDLHPRYATVIRLRLCEEKPRAACAAALGVSVETFDVLLLRAVRAFRKAYGEPDAG